MTKLFQFFITEAIMATVLAVSCSAGGGDETPKPTKPPTTQHTDKHGLPIEKPVPTGCDGKIIKREYDGDTATGDHGNFTITYQSGDCATAAIVSEKISFEQDLNARCWEGNYFPQCLTWWETHGPGIRMPSDPATGG